MKIAPLHPAEFRRKHKLSKQQLHQITGIPEGTLSAWLSHPKAKRYSDPTIGILYYFGLLDALKCAGVNVYANSAEFTPKH